VDQQTPTAPGIPGMRVATIPFTDPYVDAVLPRGAVRVGPAVGPSPWLDPAHVEAHAGEVDVLHLHVGPVALRPAALETWAETVRRVGIPLVVTVHRLDARGGGHRDRSDAGLAAVLAHAEVVLTLTPGAADEIAERFGRTAIVVAHPTVALPVAEIGAERGLVGLVLASPLPDAPAPLVRAALSGAVSGGGRLRVLVEPGADVPTMRELAAEDEIELLEVCRGGEGWAAELQRLHVAVLPERCGGHSRDLEICRDVGTRVVAPGCGWFAEQWSEVVTYGVGEDGGLDAVSVAAAVAAALTRPLPRPADRAWREEQLAAVRNVHAQVYAQVAADRVS
jgi:Glycosyltransferase Family 4